MKVDVVYKKITVPLQNLLVKGSKFVILVDSKMHIIDYLGKQYPSIDMDTTNVDKLYLKNGIIFLTKETKEAFFCKLGDSVIKKIPIRFETIRFGKRIIFSYENGLFLLNDLNTGRFEGICDFGGRIEDFVCSRSKIYVVANNEVFYSSFPFGSSISLEKRAFQTIGFLRHFQCRKLHISSFPLVFAENSSYLICIFKHKPVLIQKPELYYSLSFTKYNVIFLTEKVLIVSVFTGKVDRAISLTGFISCYDSKTRMLWVYSNSLFGLLIDEDKDMLCKHLVDQNMFQPLMRMMGTQTCLLEKYVEHLFKEERFEKALKHFMILDKPLYFDEETLLHDLGSGSEKPFVELSCDFLRSIRVPRQVFLNFLFKKAMLHGEYADLALKISFLRGRFKVFTRIMKKTFSKEAEPLKFICEADYEACNVEQKRMIEEYSFYASPVDAILKKISSEDFIDSKKLFLRAYKKGLIKSSDYSSIKSLVTLNKSKSVMRVFAEEIGSECIQIMHGARRYENLSHYISFSKCIGEDMQMLLRIIESQPYKRSRRILHALEKRLSCMENLKAFLDTIKFLLSQKPLES